MYAFHQKHHQDLRNQLSFSKPPGNSRGEGEQGALRGAQETRHAHLTKETFCLFQRDRKVCQELSNSGWASGGRRGAEERWGSGWVQGVTTTRVWCSANKVGSTLIARVLKNKNCPRQESYLRPTHDQKSKKRLCSEHVVGRTRTLRRGNTLSAS